MDDVELVHRCTLISHEQNAVDLHGRRAIEWRMDDKVLTRAQQMADAARLRRDQLVAELRQAMAADAS